jgi:hypothetical protein
MKICFIRNNICYYVSKEAGVDRNPIMVRSITGPIYQLRMVDDDDDDDCRAINRMNEWQGKPKYLKKFCTMPPCLSHVPHDLNRDRTRAAEVGSQPLTT